MGKILLRITLAFLIGFPCFEDFGGFLEYGFSGLCFGLCHFRSLAAPAVHLLASLLAAADYCGDHVTQDVIQGLSQFGFGNHSVML